MTAGVLDREDIVTAIRDFADRTCGTREQREKLTDGGRDTHSPELFTRLADAGWTGICLPEQFGGGGAGVTDTCTLLEELEYRQVPVFGLSITLIVGEIVRKFGSDQQREDVLGSICAGQPKSLAMSEPDAGSDVGSLRTAARKTPDGWVLNGQKTWITNAHHCDQLIIVARTGREGRKHDGLSMFLVSADHPGVDIRPIQTMAGREVNDVFLTDVELGPDALVGRLDNGWKQLMSGLAFERLLGSATMLGVARRAFDDTVDYVKTRTQFGRPVGFNQALKHRIADLATEIECTRLLVYDVAARLDREPEAHLARESSMCKLKASELARRTALDGMQMMGGAGYATEYDMEKLVRKALPMTIYGGTSEIQREIIGSSFGL